MKRIEATRHAFGQNKTNGGLWRFFSFFCGAFGHLSRLPFPSSHSVVVEASRSGTLQEAEPWIGMYYFIAVGTSFYLRRFT